MEDDEVCASACVDELTRAGWRCLHFGSAAAALEAAARGKLPKVLLMDLGLPGEDAFAAITGLTRSMAAPAIVVLTGRAAQEAVFRALRAGAVGYVLKNDAIGRLTGVLEEVRRGGAPMSPSIARRVIDSFRAPIDLSESSPLTRREQDVLGMLAKGLSYGESATSLTISVDTVRSHVRRIYEKLHAANKTEAIAHAMRAGLLQ